MHMLLADTSEVASVALLRRRARLRRLDVGPFIAIVYPALVAFFLTFPAYGEWERGEGTTGKGKREDCGLCSIAHRACHRWTAALAVFRRTNPANTHTHTHTKPPPRAFILLGCIGEASLPTEALFRSAAKFAFAPTISPSEVPSLQALPLPRSMLTQPPQCKHISAC